MNMDSCCKVFGLPEISLPILLLCMGRQMKKKKPSPVLRSLYLSSQEQYHSCFYFFDTKHEWLKPSRRPRSWVLWQVPLVLMLMTAWQADKAVMTKVEGLSLVMHNQLRNKQFPFPRKATEYETFIKPWGIPFWIQLPWPQQGHLVEKKTTLDSSKFHLTV